ncbi:MAG: hypothetical protein O3B87_01525 [bacterium]|nr:hypothetical protein [bacterium]
MIKNTNEKILNARISKKLYEKVSQKAKRNRTTVSNLIRNIIEDTLEIHNDFHDAVDKKITKYLSNAQKEDIVGFQEMFLAKDAQCVECEKIIKSPSVAYFAFFENNDSRVIICESCKTRNTKEKINTNETSSDS